MYITLSEYIFFSLISLLATAPDGLTEMGERYGRETDNVELSVLVPFTSQFVHAIEEFGVFHIVWSTYFDDAQRMLHSMARAR